MQYQRPNVQQNRDPNYNPRPDIKDLVHGMVGDVMGYGPTKIPGTGMTIPGGPVRGFAQTTGLGLLGGYLGSKAYNWVRGGEDEEKDRRTKAWMLAGGLAGGVPSGLALLSTLGGDPVVPAPKVASTGDKLVKGASVMLKVAMDRVQEKMASPIDLFPVSHSLSLVSTDPGMTPVEKAMAMNVILQASDGRDRGLIGFGDLVRGAVGAGLGYVGGVAVAKTMDALLGLPDPMQQILHATGAIGGALVASGLMSSNRYR